MVQGKSLVNPVWISIKFGEVKSYLIGNYDGTMFHQWTAKDDSPL